MKRMIEVDKFTAQKYEDHLFTTELIKMFSDLLLKRDYALQVFSLIFENSLNTSRKQFLRLGITKTELTESIKIYSKKKKNNKFIDAEIYMTRKICDDIVNFLIGATLIYYDEREREKPLIVTVRGKQIAKELIERKLIKNPVQLTTDHL